MKSRRSIRGLSPIFATLILIAIAVIAGIIVYMFTSGTLAAMMGGGTAGQEKVAIQAVEAAATQLKIFAQSTGGGNVIVDTVIVKFAGNASIARTYSGTAITAGGTITDTLAPITVTVLDTDLVPAENYIVTVVSKAGGSFVSPSFKGV